MKTSEKGSDVNLATHLLHDAYRNRFEVAAVISGDTDLLEAVRIVTKELKKTVGIICPQPRPPTMLLQAATFYKQIRANVISASQFPPFMKDAHGSFHKP
ncbi:MAG: NYN domain-containing protein, partial [Limisphaerales bacterium]